MMYREILAANGPGGVTVIGAMIASIFVPIVTAVAAVKLFATGGNAVLALGLFIAANGACAWFLVRRVIDGPTAAGLGKRNVIQNLVVFCSIVTTCLGYCVLIVTKSGPFAVFAILVVLAPYTVLVARTPIGDALFPSQYPAQIRMTFRLQSLLAIGFFVQFLGSIKTLGQSSEFFGPSVFPCLYLSIAFMALWLAMIARRQLRELRIEHRG